MEATRLIQKAKDLYDDLTNKRTGLPVINNGEKITAKDLYDAINKSSDLPVSNRDEKMMAKDLYDATNKSSDLRVIKEDRKISVVVGRCNS
ncbi:hypothetical protein AgCh_039595 [Apium graveolens]